MNPTTTWEIQRSIAFELEVAATLITDYIARASLPAYIAQLLDMIPAEMKAETRALLVESRHFYNLFVPAAYAAGVLFEEDYSRATLAMRQMDAAEALQRLLARAAVDGLPLTPDASLPAPARFKQAAMQLNEQSMLRLGFAASAELHPRHQEADLELLTQVLTGGEQHARFWHWLDRFYYQVYQPWRQTRQAFMATQEERARLALGAPGSPLQVDWLPQVSPLRTSHTLIQAMQARNLHVIFVVEPFGLSDAWNALPAGPVLTFSESSELYQHFYDALQDVSARLKALADPTRLVILRLIRSAPQDNTDIAAYLGISRPTVSIHARQLRQAGLIRTYEEGRSVRHEVIASEVRRLFRDLEQLLDLPPEEPPD